VRPLNVSGGTGNKSPEGLVNGLSYHHLGVRDETGTEVDELVRPVLDAARDLPRR